MQRQYPTENELNVRYLLRRGKPRKRRRVSRGLRSEFQDQQGGKVHFALPARNVSKSKDGERGIENRDRCRL